MICLSVSAGSSKLVGSSPSAITGKSSRGSVARLKRARPAMIGILPSAAASSTCAALGQLARDIEQRVRRNGGRARLIDRGRDRFVDLQIEIGRHQLQRALGGRLDQHVGQDRDGVAPLDHRLDMAEALQKGRAFDRRLHHQSPGPPPHFSFPPGVVAGGNSPSPFLNAKKGRSKRPGPSSTLRFTLTCPAGASEAEADAGDHLMTVGIDVEVVGVRAAGIFKPRIAIVRIAIFELGVGIAAERLLDAAPRR